MCWWSHVILLNMVRLHLYKDAFSQQRQKNKLLIQTEIKTFYNEECKMWIFLVCFRLWCQGWLFSFRSQRTDCWNSKINHKYMSGWTQCTVSVTSTDRLRLWSVIKFWLTHAVSGSWGFCEVWQAIFYWGKMSQPLSALCISSLWWIFKGWIFLNSIPLFFLLLFIFWGRLIVIQFSLQILPEFVRLNEVNCGFSEICEFTQLMWNS